MTFEGLRQVTRWELGGEKKKKKKIPRAKFSRARLLTWRVLLEDPSGSAASKVE